MPVLISLTFFAELGKLGYLEQRDPDLMAEVVCVYRRVSIAR
jgi:hypothetical protein